MLSSEQVGYIVIGIVALVGFTLLSYLGNNNDADDKLLNKILDDGRKKFKAMPYKLMLEFIRNDIYNAIKIAQQQDKDIQKLSKEYLLITHEIDRLDKEEEDLGAEFTITTSR